MSDFLRMYHYRSTTLYIDLPIIVEQVPPASVYDLPHCRQRLLINADPHHLSCSLGSAEMAMVCSDDWRRARCIEYVMPWVLHWSISCTYLWRKLSQSKEELTWNAGSCLCLFTFLLRSLRNLRAVLLCKSSTLFCLAHVSSTLAYTLLPCG